MKAIPINAIGEEDVLSTSFESSLRIISLFTIKKFYMNEDILQTIITMGNFPRASLPDLKVVADSFQLTTLRSNKEIMVLHH